MGTIFSKRQMGASLVAMSAALSMSGCNDWKGTQPPVKTLIGSDVPVVVSIDQNSAPELILLPMLPANHEDAPQAPVNLRIKRDAQGNLLIAELHRDVQNPERLKEAARVRDFLNDPKVRPSDVGTVWTHVVFDVVWIPPTQYAAALNAEVARWENKARNAQFAPESNFYDMYLAEQPTAWGENTNPIRTKLRYAKSYGVDPRNAPDLIQAKLLELNRAMQMVQQNPQKYGQAPVSPTLPPSAPKWNGNGSLDFNPYGTDQAPEPTPVNGDASGEKIGFSPTLIYWMRVRAQQERARQVC